MSAYGIDPAKAQLLQTSEQLISSGEAKKLIEYLEQNEKSETAFAEAMERWNCSMITIIVLTAKYLDGEL